MIFFNDWTKLMLRYFRWVFVLLLLLSGCADSDKASDASTSSSSPGTSSTESADTSVGLDEAASTKETPQEKIEEIWPKPLDKPRSTMAGNWVFYFRLMGTEFPASLLKVEAGEGKTFSATVLDTPPQVDKTELGSSALQETSVQVELNFEQPMRLGEQIAIQKLDFRGVFKDGVVNGDILLNGFLCVPGRLVATNDAQFPAVMQPKPDPLMPEFKEAIDAFQADGLSKGLREFSDSHPESTLAMDALRISFRQIKSEKMNSEAVEKMADSYLAMAEGWGPRQKMFAYLEIGSMLASSRYLPETALKYFKDAETHLTEEMPAEWKPILESTKKEVEKSYAIARLSVKNEDERKKALSQVSDYQKESPYDARLIFAMADYHEKQNQLDEAIEWYAYLTVLPMMEGSLLQEWSREGAERPLPSETLATLWKKKHGKSDGLDAHLDKVYDEQIYSFAKEKSKPRKAGDGNKVVLCELFTGAQCPPCVAADVATGALEHTYPLSDVIVLRYHQHIPRPDQLTNQDSEARFMGYYRLQSTPSLVISGQEVPGAGGFMGEAVGLFTRLRPMLDSILEEKTEVSLTLSAMAENGKLNLSAEVSGVKELTDNLRLRLVLAEDTIDFRAGNGIRKHEMIVRTMPGGVLGIKPKDGKLQYSESLDLRGFKQKLVDYLAAFEEGNNVTFPAKPLDLDKLHLVAFVQDDSTREVLQAVSIPVSGKLDYSVAKKPAAAAPQTVEKEKKVDAKKESKPAEASKPE